MLGNGADRPGGSGMRQIFEMNIDQLMEDQIIISKINKDFNFRMKNAYKIIKCIYD